MRTEDLHQSQGEDITGGGDKKATSEIYLYMCIYIYHNLKVSARRSSRRSWVAYTIWQRRFSKGNIDQRLMFGVGVYITE